MLVNVKKQKEKQKNRLKKIAVGTAVGIGGLVLANKLHPYNKLNKAWRQGKLVDEIQKVSPRTRKGYVEGIKSNAKSFRKGKRALEKGIQTGMVRDPAAKAMLESQKQASRNLNKTLTKLRKAEWEKTQRSKITGRISAARKHSDVDPRMRKKVVAKLRTKLANEPEYKAPFNQSISFIAEFSEKKQSRARNRRKKS